jgi:hypothetical protein
MQIHCNLDVSLQNDQDYDESVDVPVVLVTNRFIYNQPTGKKRYNTM